jgi:hypothetical protein
LLLTASSLVDLRALRIEFDTQFAEWDQCVAEENILGAKRVRRYIQAAARERLDSPAANMPGLYVFVESSPINSLDGVYYIGMAGTCDRAISRRIEDRFKDDSCLDSKLDHLADEDIRHVITRRLRVALPRSGLRYVDQHIRTAELFRRSGAVVLIGCDAGSDVIADAEKILIASAVAVGCPLTNIKLRSIAKYVSKEGNALALIVIDELKKYSVSTAVVDRWKSMVQACNRCS